MAQRGRVALDTNAIIARLEGAPAEVQPVVNAIGGRQPLVSRTAVKEFLRGGGDLTALRTFLTEAEGTVGKAASSRVVNELRVLVLKRSDAYIVGSAMAEGIALLTRDKEILRKVPGIVRGF